MKLVQVLLPPDRLAAVQEQLSAVEVFRLTVSDVQGVRLLADGRPLTADSFDTRPMVKLEIGVNEDFVRPTVQAVLEAGAEAGKIFLLPLDDVIRIRTGEHGSEAI
jgi:nitrogen regulatory protein P-II 1